MLKTTLPATFVAICVTTLTAVCVSAGSGHGATLDDLVSPEKKAFLADQLSRIEPPERIRLLSGYGERQSELGGGFYGILPGQLADADSIPIPAGEEGRLDAALCLARQRAANLVALEAISPDYPLTFSGASLADFLSSLDSGQAGAPEALRLEIDTSVLDGFFDAIADGEVGVEEALVLAQLSPNQAMLEHRRNLGYIPEPLPDTGSLAEMIRMAGSADPLDRLWCWINPQNDFGYADLRENAGAYRRFLAALDDGRPALEAAVVRQIAQYAPPRVEMDARFALTVGWAIRGWTTPEMAGLNLEQVKDDWDLLFGTMVEETYHRLQLQLCPTPTGMPAREFADLVVVETGDARYERFYEVIAYTMLEGCANLARGRFADPGLSEKAAAGAELLARFVDEVVENGDVGSADALISEGLEGNGPLYGLGWKLASVVAAADGKRAVGELQRSGPVAFFRRAAILSQDAGQPLLSPTVVATINTLADL